tara:strand:- start:611 stop:733 length:123 start_codon:yes stop_codon:yes gene_type:complete
MAVIFVRNFKYQLRSIEEKEGVKKARAFKRTGFLESTHLI